MCEINTLPIFVFSTRVRHYSGVVMRCIDNSTIGNPQASPLSEIKVLRSSHSPILIAALCQHSSSAINHNLNILTSYHYVYICGSAVSHGPTAKMFIHRLFIIHKAAIKYSLIVEVIIGSVRWS